MKSRVFIFINGILNWPGSHQGWTDRAVSWTHCRTEHKAEKWEYATGALTRRLFQEERAEEIARMMRAYEDAGFEIVLVGHSNGCDIIARIFDLRFTKPEFFRNAVARAHLFSAAADESDFVRALKDGDVEQLAIYCADDDQALRVGRVSRELLGWAGIGFGYLGLGPKTLKPSSRVVIFHAQSYGHSDWFTPGASFEQTMQLIQTYETLFSHP